MIEDARLTFCYHGKEAKAFSSQGDDGFCVKNITPEIARTSSEHPANVKNQIAARPVNARRQRVLVGMETSGAIRSRLRALGIDAWSCDLLPSDDGSDFHIQGDVFSVADDDWDWAIFHPTCTYLTISAEWAYGDGPYHQKVKPWTLVGAARRDARERALDDFRRLLALPYPKAIENPIGVVSTRVRPADQIIQPWQFGDDASKATCLWLDRLPKLVPTQIVEPRMVNGRPRWGNQTDSGQNKLSPSPDRWKERSKTWPGIAGAIASQWAAFMAPSTGRPVVAQGGWASFPSVSVLRHEG